MSEIPSFWPEGLSRTFWNYGALKQARDIPFMGYEFDNRFTLAFAIGAALVILFAVRRFNTRSYDTGSFKYRVLEELVPMELRRGELMQRAYTRYALALLAIYSGLTLFGKLIIEAFNTLPAAGLQVDASAFDFTSPNWPLFVSFGMIGLAPMIPPVEVAENRIRAWSHKAAGIPVQIAELTNRIKKELDALSREEASHETAPDPNVPDWVTGKVANPETVRRVLVTRQQLQWLVNWLRDERAYWPSAEVRGKLRKLERSEIAEAEEVMADFNALLQEVYDAPAGVGGNGSLSEADKLDLHKRRLERNWRDQTAQMATLRDELASILVIYAEHDPGLERIDADRLEHVMTAAMADRYGNDGPEYWVFLSVVGIAVCYTIAVLNGSHGLFGNVASTLSTKAVTVTLETLRVVALFVAPLLIAMGMRHYMLERSHDPWVPLTPNNFGKRFVQQLVQVSLVAIFVSAVCMILLSFLWGALLSTSPQRLQEIMFGPTTRFVLFYPTQSIITTGYIVAVLVAVDAMQFLTSPLRHGLVLIYGVLGAAAVAVLWSWHLRVNFGSFFTCGEDLVGFWLKLAETFSESDSCYSAFGGTDLVLYTLLTFLSATLFILRPKIEQESQKSLGGVSVATEDVKDAPVARSAAQDEGRRSKAAAIVVAVMLAVTIALIGPARAQDAARETPTEKPKEVVRIGLREDVEPFSFRMDLASGPEYLGYIAKFCAAVFPPGGKYRVEIVKVTATNRFDTFLKEAGRETKSDDLDEIDVLCDPTTLRFSEIDGREEGVFSPIIFVSGVSYIHRRPRRAQRGANVILGYVKGSTARETAIQACRGNLFKIHSGQPASGRTDCNSAKEDASFANCYPAIQADADAAADAAYVFCEFPSHTSAIDWFCLERIPTERLAGGATEDITFERVYIGDRDIVVGKYETMLRERPDCSVGTETNFESFTYEPYALITRKSRPDLIQYVQRRVYEIFSNRPLAEALFASAFSRNGATKRMTRALGSLYLLNGVEQAERFTGGSAFDEASGATDAR